MEDAHVLGIDVGTSGVKAVLVSMGGDVVASTTTPLTLSTPRPGWAEQDPDAWWRASIASIRAVRETYPNARVAAVGISGQMHSSVFLDREGRVIRPALLWCDGRTTAECREIEQRVGGEERLRDLVANPALEGFTLCAELEGIIPALESSHAIIPAVRIARELPQSDAIIVNLSGRGDKDVQLVAELNTR